MKQEERGLEMNSDIRVAIIIPCYNEQGNVLDLYEEINTTAFDNHFSIEPIFINDCSTDNTEKVLLANKINYLNLPINLGIGGAVQLGFIYAFRNGFDIAVQMDGDGQHPPSELEKLLHPIINNKADVVIGSRYLTKDGFQSSFLRRIGINYFNSLNKLLTGYKINDSTSGYRALNRKALELVSEYYPDEYPEPETIVLFSMNGLAISEVAVKMRKRQEGKSSIRHYKTIYYMFKVTLGIIFLYIRLKINGKHHII